MRRIWPAIIFLALAFLIRLPILHRSVLDWDESLYFLMARAWLDGHLPYTTIWDNKPPGIYAIFAIFQLVIPGIEAIRIAAVICVSVLAWATSEITVTLSGNRLAGWITGGLIILCTLSNDGLSSNTEPFMDCFTVLAILAILKDAPVWLAGLLLGCCFMIKYVCAPEILVALALLWHRRRSAWPVTEAILAAAIPLLFVTLLYALAGKLPLWWECGIASNFRRAEVPLSAQSIWAAVKQQSERWGPLYLTGLWAALRFDRPNAPSWFIPSWLLAALIGASGAKSFYDHYFLEVLPVLCIAAGLIFDRLPRRWLVRTTYLLIIACQPARAGWIALSSNVGPDPQRIAAKELLAAGATSLYVFDGQPILYALTNLPPPTYYVFPSNLIGNLLPKVVGVDPAKEVTRILNKRPEYIVCHSWAPDPTRINELAYSSANKILAAHYMLWRHVTGINIYKLKIGLN